VGRAIPELSAEFFSEDLQAVKCRNRIRVDTDGSL
jgi:hypothetical protein